MKIKVQLPINCGMQQMHYLESITLNVFIIKKQILK